MKTYNRVLKFITIPVFLLSILISSIVIFTEEPPGKIFFVSYGHSKKPELYVINEDKTGLTRLTNDEYENGQPVLSPDSTKVLYLTYHKKYVETWMVGIDGSNSVKLGQCSEGIKPSWSPDGQKAVFIADIDGTRGAFVVQTDNLEPIRITPTDYECKSALWSPKEAKILLILKKSKKYQIGMVDNDGNNFII